MKSMIHILLSSYQNHTYAENKQASPFHIIHDVPSLAENNDKTNKAITLKGEKNIKYWGWVIEY
jgi:hypothetical protein